MPSPSNSQQDNSVAFWSLNGSSDEQVKWCSSRRFRGAKPTSNTSDRMLLPLAVRWICLQIYEIWDQKISNAQTSARVHYCTSDRFDWSTSTGGGGSSEWTHVWFEYERWELMGEVRCTEDRLRSAGTASGRRVHRLTHPNAVAAASPARPPHLRARYWTLEAEGYSFRLPQFVRCCTTCKCSGSHVRINTLQFSSPSHCYWIRHLLNDAVANAEVILIISNKSSFTRST